MITKTFQPRYKESKKQGLAPMRRDRLRSKKEGQAPIRRDRLLQRRSPARRIGASPCFFDGPPSSNVAEKGDRHRATPCKSITAVIEHGASPRFLLELAVLLSAALLALVPSGTSVAQSVANSFETIEPKSREDGPTIIRLNVSPAAAPTPRLRYRFDVPPHQTVAGNAATAYMRSFGEQGFYGPRTAAIDKFGADRFYEFVGGVGLHKIPVEDIRGASQFFDGYVRNYISRATLCRECDWGHGEEDISGDEYLLFLLPFMQESRSISRVLSLQTRCAIAERDYERAIDRMRMNYQLGHNVGKTKILVCSLIGIAEYGIATQTVLDLIAAPDSPNLYWALGSIPDPENNFHKALQLDLSLGPRILGLVNIEEQDFSNEEWKRRLLRATTRLADNIGERNPRREPSLVESLAATGATMARYQDAKQRLIDSGMAGDRVDAMPVGQVVLIDATREYQRFSDVAESITFLPWSEARKRLEELNEMYLAKGTPSLGHMMAEQIMPATAAMYEAVIRIQRMIAAVQVVEAIRMYAAEHGSMPQSLDQIKAVYVPLNPATQKPFAYRVQGNKAIIDLPISDGMPVATNFASERYEITLTKKAQP